MKGSMEAGASPVCREQGPQRLAGRRCPESCRPPSDLLTLLVIGDSFITIRK